VSSSGDTVAEMPEITKVLVKLFFTNAKLIPDGIRMIPRREGKIETKHGMEAKKLGIPKGAQRKGRYDTGKDEELHDVDLAPRWKQLKDNFQITDIHCFLRAGNMYTEKPVIVVNFTEDVKEFPGDNKASVKKSLIEVIEKNFVHGSKWGVVHQQINPNGIQTLNCSVRKPIQS